MTFQIKPNKRAIKRLFLLSGVMGVGVGLSSLMAQTVYAQTNAELQPTKGWSVQKVQADTPYCALSRAYDNESVLSFGRSNEDEYSVAIDFQKPALDPTQNYTMSMQSGPGKFRAYQMTPISPNAFVVSLGDDVSFLKTLADSQSLKIKIAEDQYTYATPDFENALSDLQACQNTSQMAKADEAPAKPEPQKEVTAKTNKKDAAQADILNAEAKSADTNFKAQKMTAAPAIPAPQVEAEQFQEVEETVITAESKPVLKPEDILSMGATKTQETDVVMSKVEPKEDVIEPRVKIEAPKVENKNPKAVSKKAEPKEVKAVKPEVKPSEPAKAVAMAPERSTEQALKFSSADYKKIAKAEMLEKEVAALKERNAQLLSNVARADAKRDFETQQELAQARTRIQSVQEQLDAAKTDNAKLLNDLERLRLVNEEQVMTSISGDADLEQVTKRYHEAEREVQRLARKIEIERTSCQAKMAETESMLFDPALSNTAQRSQLSSLEKELETLRAQQKDNAADVEEKIAQAMKAKDAELSQKEIAINKKEKELAAMQDKITSLQKEAEEKSLKLSSLGADIQRLTANLAEEKAKPDYDPSLAIEKQALEKQFSDVSAEKAKLSAELMTLRAELKAQQAQNENLQSSKYEAQAMKQELQKVMADKQALQDRLVAAQESLKFAQSEKAGEQEALQGRLAMMEERLKSAQAELANEKSVLAALQAEKAELQTAKIDANALKNELEVLRQNKINMQAALQVAKTEKEQLMADVSSLQTQLNTARQQVAQKTSSDAAQSQQLASAKTQMERMQSQFAAKDQEIQNLRNRMAQKDQELNQKLQDLNSAQSKVQQMNANSSQTNSEISSLKQELQSLRSEMQSQRNTNLMELASLRREKAGLEAELSERGQAMKEAQARAKVAQQAAAKSAADARAQEAALARQAQQAQVAAAKAAAEARAKSKEMARLEAARVSQIAPAAGYSAQNSTVPTASQPRDNAAISQTQLSNMLSAAGLRAGPIQSAGSNAYRWKAGSLDGYANIQKLASAGDIEGAIQSYIGQKKSQCQGDFASMPTSAATRRTSYEVACISPVSSKSSSILFFEKEGSLVAIAHEIDATDMDVAMDARDRLLGQVSSIRSARY